MICFHCSPDLISLHEVAVNYKNNILLQELQQYKATTRTAYYHKNHQQTTRNYKNNILLQELPANYKNNILLPELPALKLQEQPNYYKSYQQATRTT